jgi:hypothetical protein
MADGKQKALVKKEDISCLPEQLLDSQKLSHTVQLITSKTEFLIVPEKVQWKCP